MKNPNRGPRKTSSRQIVVCALALLTASCGSGGDGTGNGGSGGNGGAQAAAGRGGSAGGGSGAAGTSGSAGSSGGTGTAGTTGSGGGSGAAGTGGSAGAGGSAGTSGSAGAGGRGGATAGTTGTAGGGAGGAAGRGGQSGNAGNAGSAGGAGGAAGRGGNGGAAGRGGAGGTAGSAGTGGNPDGGSTDAVVVQDGATMTGGAFVRTAWTAAYTCTGTCPAQGPSDTADADTKRAFDGNRGTRWSTGQYQQTSALMTKFPLYFTVDMKQVVNVSRITLDAGTQDTYDAPGQMDVLLSVDGTNYTTIVSAHKPVSPMTGATDTITFTQTPARYIQLKATMTIKQVTPSLGDRYWAIGEMNVYP